jgi:hypothetical protein
MINQGNNVPDNTIAVFTDPFVVNLESKERDRLFNVIEKSPKKRDWFTPPFYRCLPLLIGNQAGFIIKSEYDFGFMWNGNSDADSIIFYFNEEKESVNTKYPLTASVFGEGIISIGLPFWLRTPPGVDLMTINPPNYTVPNLTTMTGIVETDNLRRDFTINLKVQIPNIQVFIPAGTPLAALLPIPRGYSNQFELKYAEDIFSQELIDEEIQAKMDVSLSRNGPEKDLPNQVGRQYFRGEDVYGNKFPEHQGP